MSEPANPSRPENAANCESIQSVLCAYLTRDLGAAQADLVREHLKKCPVCRADGADLRRTLGALREASRSESRIPTRLSDARRARVLRAFMHPVLDWMYAHHALVSVVLAALALALLVGALRWVGAWRAERWETGVEVLIGRP